MAGWRTGPRTLTLCSSKSSTCSSQNMPLQFHVMSCKFLSLFLKSACSWLSSWQTPTQSSNFISKALSSVKSLVPEDKLRFPSCFPCCLYMLCFYLNVTAAILLSKLRGFFSLLTIWEFHDRKDVSLLCLCLCYLSKHSVVCVTHVY